MVQQYLTQQETQRKTAVCPKSFLFWFALSMLICSVSQGEGGLVARDVDNGLELGIRVVSGEFKPGGSCTFRVWVKNVGEEDICVVHPPLGADALPRLINDGGWEDPMGDPTSWRDLYQEHPAFCSRGRTEYAFDFRLRAKKARQDEFDRFCRLYKVEVERVRIVFLASGHFYGRDVTIRIPSEGGFVDSGMFFNIEKLEATALREQTPYADIYRRQMNLTPKVPIWEGSLYVFLKIPD